MGAEEDKNSFIDLLKLQVTNTRYFNIPFVRGIVQDGHYIAHPQEPTIFTPFPNGISGYWASWLMHVLVRGEAGVENFKEYDDPMEFPPEMRRVAHAVFLILSSEIASKEVVLAKEPPPILTDNGIYISQRWVMDTCRRDNMKPYEAVVLAQGLLR